MTEILPALRHGLKLSHPVACCGGNVGVAELCVDLGSGWRGIQTRTTPSRHLRKGSRSDVRRSSKLPLVGSACVDSRCHVGEASDVFTHCGEVGVVNGASAIELPASINNARRRLHPCSGRASPSRHPLRLRTLWSLASSPTTESTTAFVLSIFFAVMTVRSHLAKIWQVGVPGSGPPRPPAALARKAFAVGANGELRGSC